VLYFSSFSLYVEKADIWDSTQRRKEKRERKREREGERRKKI